MLLDLTPSITPVITPNSLNAFQKFCELKQDKLAENSQTGLSVEQIVFYLCSAEEIK